MESSTLNEEKLLFSELEKAVVEYRVSCFDEVKRQNLLDVLQNNDCRELVAKCVDGDVLSNAFVWACVCDHAEILKAFLNYGMNADIKDNCDDTALIQVCIFGHEEAARLLLSHNSNVDQQTKNSWTALMCASQEGFKEIVQLLLDQGADIDLKNSRGETAVDLATTTEIKEMIQNHVNTSYTLK